MLVEAAGVKCSSLTAFQNVSDHPHPLACYYDHTIALYCITRTMFQASLSTSGATRLRQLVPGEIKEPCATYPLSGPVSLSPLFTPTPPCLPAPSITKF